MRLLKRLGMVVMGMYCVLGIVVAALFGEHD